MTLEIRVKRNRRGFLLQLNSHRLEDLEKAIKEVNSHFGEEKNGSRRRYDRFSFCPRCTRWLPKGLRRCPYCGGFLRYTPKHKSKNRNQKRFTVEDAVRIYNRMRERGYSVTEAVEYVEAVTGVDVTAYIEEVGKVVV